MSKVDRMPPLTPTLVVRLVMLVPPGAVLIAAGLGIGESLVRPALVAVVGAPEVWQCITSPDVMRHQIAETALGTAPIAMLVGALAKWRRLDGWLLINVPSMILGYALHARATAALGEHPGFRFWGLTPYFIQFLLVCTLYPWLFERSAAWRRVWSSRD